METLILGGNADALPPFEVQFALDPVQVGADLADVTRAFASRCELEANLHGTYAQRMTPTEMGTLGGFWEGIFAFVKTQGGRIHSVVKVLQATYKNVTGQRGIKFRVSVVRTDGSRFELDIEELASKDWKQVDKFSDKIIQFLMAVPD